MSERVGLHPASRLILNPIVANCRRGVERFLRIALLEDVALRGRVPPDSGEAVGLQLETHRELIGRVGARFLRLADARIDTAQMLHVVPELVGDDIRLREITGRAEPAAQLVIEPEIDVDLFVGRAIERPHR